MRMREVLLRSIKKKEERQRREIKKEKGSEEEKQARGFSAVMARENRTSSIV